MWSIFYFPFYPFLFIWINLHDNTVRDIVIENWRPQERDLKDGPRLGAKALGKERGLEQGCAIIPLPRAILILISHYRKIDPYWGVIDIAKIGFSMLLLILVLQKQISYYHYWYWYCKSRFLITIIGIGIARVPHKVLLLVLVLHIKVFYYHYWYWYCNPPEQILILQK